MIRPRAGYHRGMDLPRPRGPLSEATLRALMEASSRTAPLEHVEAATAEDRALTLWVLHQLHYRPLAGVPDDLEWDPDLLALRLRLEGDLESELRSRFVAPTGLSITEDLLDWASGQDGPSVAAFVQRHATREQVLELLRVRSVYHLMEADPVSWVVPRLGVQAKAALMELQYDEYGAGDPNRLHHHLFAVGMADSGLDATYGRYIDEVPTEVLVQNNVLTMFGLHRRLRAAALGHLAAFEATSSLPSRRMAQGLERLDFPASMVEYYAEHVEADAVHEQLAMRTIVGGLVAEEPRLEREAWFGAWACLDLESRAAQALLERWDATEEREVA